jgi:exonuclease SbcD
MAASAGCWLLPKMAAWEKGESETRSRERGKRARSHDCWPISLQRLFWCSFMRFIHAADLHLDSLVAGSRSSLGTHAAEMSGATRAAFRRMIDVATREKADFVLIAGDIFDRDWPDYSTGLFFANGLADLGKAGIRVALIRGNHDAANRMSRRLTWPANVHEFDSRRPATWCLDDLGVAIHGQSFPDRAVSENLAVAYPPPKAGWFNIGLLHTSADGSFGHDPYAPCAIADLIGKGYDYWALGHVHQRRVVATDPCIVFPGNLQGRHINEPGAKGFTFVTVSAGKVESAVHVAADGLRFVDLMIDAKGTTTLTEIFPLVSQTLTKAVEDSEGRAIAVRLRISGACAAHGELIARSEYFEAECLSLAEQALSTVFVERVIIETSLASAPTAAASLDLSPIIASVGDDPIEVAEVRRILEDGLRRLPAGVREAADQDLTGLSETRLAKILADAQALLAHQLAGDRRA